MHNINWEDGDYFILPNKGNTMRHLITDYTHNDLIVGQSSPYHTDEDINMMEDELQRRVDEINNDFEINTSFHEASWSNPRRRIK